MKSSSNKIVKKAICSLISFLIALAGIELYMYKPVNTYICENLTDSNLIPYIMFILIYCLLFIILINVTKYKISNVLMNMEYKKSVIIMTITSLISIILLIGCYLNEVNLFDGPTENTQLYRQNNIITICILLLIFLFSYFMMNKDIKLSDNRVVYVVAIIAGIIYMYALYLPNVYSQQYNIYHFDAYFNTINMAVNGIARTGINSGVYGYYAFLIAPLLKIIGGGLKSYMILNAILAFISYIGIVYVIIQIINNKYIKIFSVIALIVITCSFQTGVYFQLIPHRVFFLGIIMAYLMYGMKKKLCNRLPYICLGIIISALAVIWNFETGIVYTAGFCAYYVISAFEKYSLKNLKLYLSVLIDIAGLAATICLGWIITGLFNVLFYHGDFLSFKQFIFPLMNSNYFEYLKYEYQKGIVAWLIVAFFALYYIGTALYNTKLNREYSELIWKDKYMCLVGIITLGIMAYYINRPAYGNLFIVHFVAIVMFAVLADKCIKINLSTENSEFLKLVSKGIGTVSYMLVIACCIAGIINYIYVRNYNIDSQMRNTSGYNETINMIKNDCEPDTKAIGFAIPMLYYEMGWNSGYYLIDFSDLDVNKESWDYIQNILDNLNEPFIIDSMAMTTLEDKGIDMTNFLSEFELFREYELGSDIIQYWKPIGS